MKFKPLYKITDKILNNISQLIAGKEVIEYSKIIPKWEISLKKEARIHNAHSSTSIEGNPLPLTQVKRILKNKPEYIRDSQQEILNYNQAIE